MTTPTVLKPEELKPIAGLQDVKAVAPSVLNLRILFNCQSRFDKPDTTSDVALGQAA